MDVAKCASARPTRPLAGLCDGTPDIFVFCVVQGYCQDGSALQKDAVAWNGCSPICSEVSGVRDRQTRSGCACRSPALRPHPFGLSMSKPRACAQRPSAPSRRRAPVVASLCRSAKYADVPGGQGQRPCPFRPATSAQALFAFRPPPARYAGQVRKLAPEYRDSNSADLARKRADPAPLRCSAPQRVEADKQTAPARCLPAGTGLASGRARVARHPPAALRVALAIRAPNMQEPAARLLSDCNAFRCPGDTRVAATRKRIERRTNRTCRNATAHRRHRRTPAMRTGDLRSDSELGWEFPFLRGPRTT